MIVPIPGLFSTGEVAAIRHHLAGADWVDGLQTAGAQAAGVKRNEQIDQQSELGRQLGELVLNRLAQTPAFVSAALPLKILPPTFNRYREGGEYGLHVDNAIRVIPGTGVRVRTDLSATLFLSDPEAYDGGELHIQSRGGDQPIKLAAGDLILYSSTSLHRVAPVTRGERLAAFFWIQSMVRDHEQREMLHELDLTVQSITRQQGPQGEDATRLSALYHRLIQQWADT